MKPAQWIQPPRSIDLNDGIAFRSALRCCSYAALSRKRERAEQRARVRAYFAINTSIERACRPYTVFSPPKNFFAYGFGNSVTFPFSVGATSVLLPGRASRVRNL